MILKRTLLAVTVIIMCFLGFSYDASLYANRYSYRLEEKGLHFTPYSMAYTELFPEVSTDRFSIEFTITPEFSKPTRLGMILEIYDKINDSQVAVGQWEHSLVILNSDDYSNSRKLPKIYAPLSTDTERIQVSILSGPGGTSVYMNGKLLQENPYLLLAPPLHGEKSHLVVGNGMNGSTPWQGTIHSLGIYGQKKESPLLLYNFTQVNDTLIDDQSNNHIPLILPREVHALQKTVLRVPKLQEFRLSSVGTDIFINFFGFIPLGFLIVINLRRDPRKKDFLPIAAAILICFLFSLAIEMRQVWLPGRDSSLLDLLLNVGGGAAGAVLTVFKHLDNQLQRYGW